MKDIKLVELASGVSDINFNARGILDYVEGVDLCCQEFEKIVKTYNGGNVLFPEYGLGLLAGSKNLEPSNVSLALGVSVCELRDLQNVERDVRTGDEIVNSYELISYEFEKLIFKLTINLIGESSFQKTIIVEWT